MVLPFVGLAVALAQAQRELPPAPGPHIHLSASDFAEAKSFSSADRIVGTYYFYWYDANTKEHILNGDGSDALTDHPASLADFSYRSARWHQKELADMTAAGIDFLLPVFWGAPSEQNTNAMLHWSYAGLPPLVQAREELLPTGKQPPRIGLFYDTSTLQHNSWREHIDLTTELGKRWFYATIRDFFSLVPPRHWAMIEGKPIVFLYSSAFAKKHDQGCIEYVREQFPKDFGERVPYLVREVSWRVQADNTYAWGGALGLKNPGVAALGPGYDHSAVPGRAPLIVKREGGQFYEANWLKFLRRPCNLVMVETWNELHEGTEVCESKEYGRQYIELTRKYADLFKQGWRPPTPKGQYTGAPSVSISLGKENREAGLRQVENDDGQAAAAVVGGQEARGLKPGTPSRYFYFVVDDSFKWAEVMDAVLEVQYYDGAPGTLAAEFDGSDTSAPFNGAYSPSADRVTLAGSRTWQTARFQLRGARFLNGQNRGADFRLAVGAPNFYVRQVSLARAAGAAPPANPQVQVVRTNYHGWADALLLRNATAEAVIVPAIGRVMQFRFDGEEGPFWENQRLFGRLPDPKSGEWANFGGDKTWPAPQADWLKVTPRGWPPPTAFDSLPVEAKVEGSAVTLISPVDPHYGIRTRRHVELDPAKPIMHITTEYEKVAGEPSRVAVWVITQLRDPVAVYAPVPEGSIFPAGYSQQSGALPLDLQVSRGLLSLRRDPQQSAKVGTDAGALLWVGEKVMLLIESPRLPGGEYPDAGSSAEVYTNPDPFAYVELELLGPLQTLQPGEKTQRLSNYSLLRRTGPDHQADARQMLGK